MSRNEYEIGQNRQPPPRVFGGPGGGPRGFGGPGGGRGFPGAGEKPKNFGKSIKKLFSYAKRYLPALVVAIVCAIIGTVTTLMGPGRLSDITDAIMAGMRTGIDLQRVLSICVFLLVIFVSGSLISYVQGFVMTTATQRMAKGMRTEISKKINRLPLKFFDSTTYGDVLSRVTNDVDTITMSMNQSISMLVSSITLLAGTLILMLVTNAVMAATSVASALIGLVCMRIIMKKAQPYFSRNQKNLGNMNGHIEEIYAGHNVVKAYNGGRDAIEAFDHINDALYNSNWKSQFLSGLMQPVMNFIGNLGYVAVCVIGAILVMNDKITFGVIVAFMMYISNFTQPLGQIAQSMTAMQSAAAAAERVFEFLEETEMPDESGIVDSLDEVEGEVSFEHVVFGYLPDKTIIHDFSASILPGQKVAIVGPTGAGKTTIVNLLMRFYDTDSGEIRVDGMPISKLTRRNVHSLFCMVLQDTWLFEGTIKDNVVYSKMGVTDQEVKDACKAVGMHHFIKTLPQGYDTVLGDNVNMSAGQKQLLTIARAMIENAPLLILDEATSSVDTRTEVSVQQAMDNLTKGRTSFVIAHRLSTIRNADIILVVRDGDIVESGSHDDLIVQGGFYAELYNSQFEPAS
ncbi:MAG: ABC transporter ATP-binding protein/permease [Oscillospiraceae bacterium]|nr:ABC transporter ATP-binding protein/permease [Oscillospiraceae bacterium]